jgi:hypothetical protein
MTSRRNDPSKGGYAVRVPIERPARKQPPKRPAVKSRAPEPSQADLDRHMRMQGMEQREAEDIMRGFRDTTRTRYMQGGKVDGGGAKGAAKISKVMGEFKRGELHSGKGGPKVTNPKRAKAIAISEAARKPMKKAMGGKVMGALGAAGDQAMAARAKGAEMMAAKAKAKGVPAYSNAPMIKKAYGGKVC